jgi:ribosomal protein L24E
MTNCDYCGEEVPKTGGKMLVLNSGKRVNFCSGKCEKNWEKNRKHDYTEQK